MNLNINEVFIALGLASNVLAAAIALATTLYKSSGQTAN